MFFFISVPTDEVKLVRVDQVEKFDEIAGREKAVLQYWVKDQPGRHLLRITLSSQSDIAAISIANRHDLNIYYRARVCPFDKGVVVEHIGDVFEANSVERAGEQGENVVAPQYVEVSDLADAYRTRLASAASAAKDGQYQYEVFFPARRLHRQNTPNSSQPDLEPYDLVAAPQDVCLRIAGRSMDGSTLDSNIVVVPHQAIEAALR
ncbi:MAG TPA: hypothetical protein VE397_11120 [Stellaceae bacterium]|nr:hypothetical protein [Stellaceae bacterium]